MTHTQIAKEQKILHAIKSWRGEIRINRFVEKDWFSIFKSVIYVHDEEDRIKLQLELSIAIAKAGL